MVGSRVEGGPQSIIECGMTNVPIVSTEVGIANKFLSKKCLYDPESYEVYYPGDADLGHLKENIDNHLIEKQVPKYDDFFEEILK